MATTFAVSERRIIDRPRLTKLLDESPARIKLLIAPAGYGKTTLARQWLAGRRHTWYRGGLASADVAALAAGLSMAAGEIVPDAGRRMRERIRATGHPEEDVDILAELFAEDLQEWPEDAWLAIDDFHFAMDSAASQRFVGLVSENSPVLLLITSRRTPNWATARRLMYGETQELGSDELRMQRDEAAAVAGMKGSALLEQSKGWPALIGLAAHATTSAVPMRAIPSRLYDYLAEEVFASADAETQQSVTRLALAGRFDLGFARELLGAKKGEEAISEGLRLGLFSAEPPHDYAAHPLLRDFLETQLRSTDEQAHKIGLEVGTALMLQARWDEAFDLANRFHDLELAERILGVSVDELLLAGRVATVERWLARPVVAGTSSAVVSLAAAELAFRKADHSRAEALAAQAAARLPKRDPLLPRALARAGQSALLASREEEGFEHLLQARAHAQRAADQRETLIGLFFAACELGRPEAKTFLTELENLGDGSVDTALRLGVARLTQAIRDGPLLPAIKRALPTKHLVEQAADPLAKTSFLHVLANSLVLASRYDEAKQIVDQSMAIARTYRLVLPMPHLLLGRALAEHGRRDFLASHRALDEVSQYVPPDGNTYLEYSVAAIRGRLLLSERRIDESIALLERPTEAIPSPLFRSDYLASQALVHACNGSRERAALLLGDAERSVTGSVEFRGFKAWAQAILSHADEDLFAEAVRSAWLITVETGNYDAFICAYRGFPAVLTSLMTRSADRESASTVIVRARDEHLARSLGIRLQLGSSEAGDRLTPRETEVFALLQRGLTNRAIAEVLVLSESTVKVHIRHIYRKLGVCSRAEALARFTPLAPQGPVLDESMPQLRTSG